MYGAIEAGGTKFVCAVGQGTTIKDQISFPTTTPEETIDQAIAFFKQYDLDGIGIGAFGPAYVDPASPKFGRIGATPKKGWRDADFLGRMKAAIDVPYAFTTDVNVAAYGEQVYGAGKGKDNLLYWTVGTGIGASYLQDGKFLQGYSHPEMGHMLVGRVDGDDYKGTCQYHDHCLEGLACGPAIEGRWGQSAKTLADDPKVWAMEAEYIAQACVNATLLLRPDVIIFGGGVMHQLQLFPLVREAFKRQMGGYVDVPELDDYIIPIALEDQAGVIGALALAEAQAK